VYGSLFRDIEKVVYKKTGSPANRMAYMVNPGSTMMAESC
jgi:hypothetical protein